MEINTLDALVGNLLRSPIAVIGAARYRLGSRVLLDLFKHRRQLLFVIHFLRDVDGDDDLRFSIHGDLRVVGRSEEHTSELQSQSNLVCRLLLEKKKKKR